MKLTLNEVRQLRSKLNKVQFTGENTKIATYAIASNKDKLDALLKPLKEVDAKRLSNTDYQKYLGEIDELNRTMANKDADNNPIIKRATNMATGEEIGLYDIPGYYNPESDYNHSISQLNKKYKQVLDKQVKDNNEYEQLLKQEVDFDPFKISIDNIPENVSQEVMDIIFHLLNS